MAEGTRIRGLDERCAALDKALQEETLRRMVVEQNFQEQLHAANTDMIGKMEAIREKNDHLAHTMDGFQSQFRQIFERLEQIYHKDTSLLGKHPSSSYTGESSNTRPPISPEIHLRNQPVNGEAVGGANQLQLLPQGINLFPKLEFPCFDGTLARSWMLRSNSYFQLAPPMNDMQKITLASMHFEGKALQWYQHTCVDIRNLNWLQFVELISSRFDELKSGKIIGDFNKLKQTGSLSIYIEKFEELRAYMLMVNRDLTEGYFIASFISGLGEELQSFIDLFDPQTLSHAIDLAKKQELTIEAITKKNKSSSKTYTNPEVFSKTSPINEPHPPDQNSPPRKFLTRAEAIQRRAQGLCFNCDEKFSVGHRCKNRILYILMTEAEEMSFLQFHHGSEVDTEVEAEEVMVSLNAIAGSSTNTTMQLKGKFGKPNLYILVDTGSTHSFLDESLAKKMGCNIESASLMNIRVANGEKMRSNKRVADFTWLMQEHVFQYPIRLLELGGCHMVLGGDWLKKNSPIELDYNQMTLGIQVEGLPIKLKAISNLAECKFIASEAIYRMICSEDEVQISQFFALTASRDKTYQSPQLIDLLEQYKNVFVEPVSLPPAREIEVYPLVVLVDKRLIQRHHKPVSQILIQWMNSGPEKATWEDYDFIAAKFPNFDPWGQGSFKRGSNVRNNGRRTENMEFEKGGETNRGGKTCFLLNTSVGETGLRAEKELANDSIRCRFELEEEGVIRVHKELVRVDTRGHFTEETNVISVDPSGSCNGKRQRPGSARSMASAPPHP